MSKLIEKLKKLAQAVPAPMGFRTSKEAESGGKMLLLGRIKADGAATAKIDTAADAVLIYTGKDGTVEDIQKTAKALGGVPWGVYIEEGGDMAALAEAGGDFVVFSPTVKVNDLPQDEKIGKVLEVESSMDDGLLRAINDVPADAVIITDTLDSDECLTLHRLMVYRHLTNFISKPLIAPVPADIGEAELKALLDAEIDGVMAEGEDLKELKKAIGKLPTRSTKKRERGSVSLPRMGGETMETPDEEDDE